MNQYIDETWKYRFSASPFGKSSLGRVSLHWVSITKIIRNTSENLNQRCCTVTCLWLSMWCSNPRITSRESRRRCARLIYNVDARWYRRLKNWTSDFDLRVFHPADYSSGLHNETVDRAMSPCFYNRTFETFRIYIHGKKYFILWNRRLGISMGSKFIWFRVCWIVGILCFVSTLFLALLRTVGTSLCFLGCLSFLSGLITRLCDTPILYVP